MILNLGIAPFEYTLDFRIPDVPNIGLFLSGGLDSSALLCLILEELKQTGRNTPVHVYTCDKPPDPKNGSRMVKLIKLEYPDHDIRYYPFYPVSEEAKANRVIDMASVEHAFNSFPRGKIIMYMAGNNSWEKTQWANLIDDIDITLPWWYPVEYYVTYPFLFMVKPQMIDIYYKLGKEHLIPYTYSCSGQLPPACETCYSCREAAWGFKRLNKTRPEFIPHSD